MHNQTFAFESDFVDSLRCIPMAVRLKLDLSKVKLSLRQWSRLDGAARRRLLDLACETTADIEAYRAALLAWAASGDASQLRSLEATTEAIVPAADRTPEQVRSFAAASGLPPIPPESWKQLTALQRFALLKLSRDNHDNVNFIPALREFGLIVG